MQLNLSREEITTIINALHVARDTYNADAERMRLEGQPRLADQFTRQAVETKELLDNLE
jgi:hypothetical protein